MFLSIGKREFITCIDHEESLQDRPRNQVVEIPARHYQHATMTHWIARRTQANRLKANMQEVYDEMAVDHALVPRFVQLKAYITCISRNSDRLVRLGVCYVTSNDNDIMVGFYRLRDFGSHFKHRSTRGILFSARQSYQQVIMNEILGVSPPDSPVRNANEYYSDGQLTLVSPLERKGHVYQQNLQVEAKRRS